MQSGNRDMKLPANEADKRAREEAWSIMPSCDNDEDCAQLMRIAADWARRQHAFQIYKATNSKIVMMLDLGATGGFFRIDIKSESGGRYLRMGVECYEDRDRCHYPENLRLSLYQFVKETRSRTTSPQ